MVGPVGIPAYIYWPLMFVALAGIARFLRDHYGM